MGFVKLAILLVSINLTTLVWADTCDHLDLIAKALRQRTTPDIATSEKAMQDDYFAKLMLAARTFELRSSSREAAMTFASLVPANDVEEGWWRGLGESCDKSLKDEMTVEAMVERLPRLLARAILLVPEKLREYIAYSEKSVLDPHSDYAMQMKLVCRANQKRFQKSFVELPPDKQAWLRIHVFDPVECRPLALPER
jgi:hypothetical protein